ncbi:unnamed protein product [Allacma fusca]|uniref:Exocyst complex subunit Exo70 C-terminal domain-containing protein n=1 Tax=Allacma fusca TaxID=39272 RepID=A0A8J2P2L5_9HEXA|nr:unnamed protein product [Allacma fusca]
MSKIKDTEAPLIRRIIKSKPAEWLTVSIKRFIHRRAENYFENRPSQKYIGPKYREFYDKYANVQFTKNAEKYIKYKPDNVSASIDSFFDVS